MTDIPDIMERRLRDLIAEARVPGMYTPDERQSFASYWIGVISPQCLEELLDEIERLRKEVEYWHMRYAEVGRGRSNLDQPKQ